MSLLYAWCNLRQHPRRTGVALAGLTFAVLLVLLQLGLLAAVRRVTTQLYECFEFDVVVVSRHYENLANLGEFDGARLIQAAVVSGVSEVLPVGVANVSWENPRTLHRATLQLVGLPLRPEFLRQPELRVRLALLAGGESFLLDTASRRGLGALALDDRAALNERLLRLAGRYTLGATLQADGGAWIELEAWRRVAGRHGRGISLGLVRVGPDADAVAVARELRATLPDDVLVFTRAEFVHGERDYFTQVKPLGIVFQLGAIVGCVAGAVMLHQVLATEIARRLREYATLKAMGFSSRFVLGAALWHASLCLAFSAAAAVVLVAGVFYAVRALAAVPAWVDGPLLGSAFGLVAALGLVSTALALRGVRRAAPAELFI